MSRLTTSFIRAVPWTVLSALLTAAHGVLMVVLLAHFLNPEEFGLASTALAIVFIIEGLSAAGIPEAVMRAPSAHTSVIDTAHTMSVALSVAGYTVAGGAAWVMADLYGDERLIGLTLVCALMLPLNALGAVPMAALKRKMRARALALRIGVSKLCGLAVLIGTGLAGLGPFVVPLATAGASAGALMVLAALATRWPGFRFVRREGVSLLRFGSWIALEGSVWTVMVRGFALLFGYFHGMYALGNFQFAFRLVDEVAALLQSSITALGLPYFSGLLRQGEGTAAAFLTGSNILFVLGAGMYGGLVLTAPDAVPLVFGDKWASAVPFIQVMALAWIIAFRTVLMPTVLKAHSAMNLLLGLVVLKSILVLGGCLVTAGLPSFYGAAVWALIQVPMMTIDLHVIRARLGPSLRTQLAGSVPAVAGLLAMALAVEGVRFGLAGDGPAVVFAGSVVVGAAVYGAVVALLDRPLLGVLGRSTAVLRPSASPPPAR